MSKISLIAALSENHCIGVNNKLPWHIPEDLKRFRKITSNHPVIMGRKTYESIGRALPDRVNIVVTRDPNWRAEGVLVLNSLTEAIKNAQEKDPVEVFVIGGGQIFQEAINLADKLYLTIVHTNLGGDTFFPDYSEFKRQVFRLEGKSSKYKYTFVDLER